MKLQDSIDKAPEQETDTEPIPMLEYRPKVRLEDDNDLTMMASNENLHAEKSAKGLSDNNGKMCANTGEVQLSSDHPSGKTLVDSVVKGDIKNQMKSGPITHESKEMEYSHRKPENLTSGICGKEAAKMRVQASTWKKVKNFPNPYFQEDRKKRV